MSFSPYTVTALAAALPAMVCAAAADTAQATAPAEALVARVTPEFKGKVRFRLDTELKNPNLRAEGDKLLVSAASIDEAIRAYGYYLRRQAHVHFSWNGDNHSAATFVLPKDVIQVPATRPYNYAFNYCTLCYSGVHWNEARWQREIDLMALNGYKYVLVTAGLEKVWQEFLTELGCSKPQIESFIANPTYSAWWHMGNLEGEGGPVHPDIIRNEAKLGRFIVKHLTELGLEPVLQGYVGFLPHAYDASRLRGRLLPQGNWVGDYERPAVLDPCSPDFPKLAERWYALLEKEYGYKAKAFGGDLFHEGGNTRGVNLPKCAAAVQKAMQKAAPDSQWFLQAWAHNPRPALLRGCDKEHTIVLLLDKDLTVGHDPYYTQDYYLKRPQVKGYRTVWCELSNFGGNQGLYGGLGVLEQLYPGKNDPMGKLAESAVGLGMISEGVETNPLFYALLTERLNTAGPINRLEFLNRYCLNRYGVADPSLIKALKLLADSVYNPDGMREGCLENVICARPALGADRASTWSSPEPYYDPAYVEDAARLMLEAGKRLGLDKLETFRYDMADITRQVLSERARAILPRMSQAYDEANMPLFLDECDRFLNTICLTAEILATSEHFLLGSFLEGAADKGGKNPEARRQMTTATRRMLTTWDKGNTALNDYAHRQMSEMMSYYYLPRWTAYLKTKTRDFLLQDAATGDEDAVEGDVANNNGTSVSYFYEENEDVDKIQDEFPTADIPLLTKPQGNVLEIAERILNADAPATKAEMPAAVDRQTAPPEGIKL